MTWEHAKAAAKEANTNIRWFLWDRLGQPEGIFLIWSGDMWREWERADRPFLSEIEAARLKRDSRYVGPAIAASALRQTPDGQEACAQWIFVNKLQPKEHP